MTKFVDLSWDDIEAATKAMITQQLLMWVGQQDKPRICAVARGGLIAATILSHQLRIPITTYISARTYSGMKNLGTEFDVSAALPKKAIKETLFVDDILDTGTTVRAILEQYPGAQFIIPVAKQSGLRTCGEFLKVSPTLMYSDADWIRFPWEVKG